MVVIEAAAYLPYEPTTDSQRMLKERLRAAVASLAPSPGKMLWATFAGPLPVNADVENALFYNIGGEPSFARLMENGVGFERDPRPLPSGVRYAYRITDTDTEPICWRREHTLAEFAATFAAPKLASIWWALRSSGGSIQCDGEPRRPSDPFALLIDLEGPKRLTPALVKCVLDGVVCGMQSEKDPAKVWTFAEAIANSVDAPTGAVGHALGDSKRSPLGSRHGLLRGHPGRIHWAPDDDRCVAARLTYGFAPTWRLTGTVAVVGNADDQVASARRSTSAAPAIHPEAVLASKLPSAFLSLDCQP
jgi:hypothetical protein